MIQPIRDRVLVRRATSRDMTPSGLYIPESAKEKANIGFVVAAGPGRYFVEERVQLSVKPGDRIIFGKYSGSEFDHEGETLLFIREDEILAVLEGEAK